MEQTVSVGPFLFARGSEGGRYRLSAIALMPERQRPPALQPMDRQAVAPVELDTLVDKTVWRYDFDLPAVHDAFYCFDGDAYAVAAELGDDLRIAYVSCNGKEHEDIERPLDERNRMWRRLAEEHDRAPFCLLLHGGDQLYADEIVHAHPTLSAWATAGPAQKATFRFSEDVRRAAETYLFQRYVQLYSQPAIAYLLSRVPSLMMWDDHDIIDGWGSLDPAVLDSDVGQGLFAVSRRMFLLFQMAATDQHPAPTQLCADGSSLTFKVAFPDFDVIAPDLRSERRPDRVMGPDGWSALSQALGDGAARGRCFLMSSVPLLGPRLSWVEMLIGIVPKLRHYEDDLRDQWQSRAHRDEWRRILTLVTETMANAGRVVTVLSGEIHLATRGEMRGVEGKLLNQLVASGIAHPAPPQVYARALGWLAVLGEDPLPGEPVRLRPLPGQRRTYVAERNYLVLDRRDSGWTASWELEESGRTPPMAI